MFLFQRKDFERIGKLVATSIIQGGPGFPVLLPAVYNYICTGEYVDQIAEVPIPDVNRVLDQVSKNRL